MPNGAADPAFNPGYGAQYGSVQATAIQPDGKILIAGNFTTYNLTNINGIARLNSRWVAGHLLQSWIGVSPVPFLSIAVGTNGAIYIGGDFTNVAGQQRQ